MTTYTATNLRDEALANLGIIQQPDNSVTRARADLVISSLANLGIVYQPDTSATRTRADWVNETLGALGVIQQSDTSATLNRAALVNNIAFILGANSAGQTLSADDYAAIDIRLDTIVGDLQARAIATVSSLATIPGAWFDALSAIAANVCKDKYGVTGDDAAKLQAGAILAETKLKNLTRTGLVDEILPQVIGDLNARGIATVSNIAAIPGAWFLSLTDIAAEFVKGKFEISNERSLELLARAKAAEFTLKTLTRGPLVDASLPSIMADLNARGIATVDLTAIPSAWFPSLADIVAEAVRPVCDVAPDIVKRVAENAIHAERTLKNLTRTYIVDRNLDAILASLAARNIIYLVDATDIPQEWFAPLAAIVADQCKGKGFDLDQVTLQRVASEGAKALAELREISRTGPSYLPQQGTYF